MPIEEYRFGSIRIDGKTYGLDVEVRSGKTGERLEVLDWWRAESHIIDVCDVERALEQRPEVLVIGTGDSGIAQVTDEAKKAVKEKGIKLIIDITGEAVKTFNIINEESAEEQGKQTKVIGFFHLTC